MGVSRAFPVLPGGHAQCTFSPMRAPRGELCWGQLPRPDAVVAPLRQVQLGLRCRRTGRPRGNNPPGIGSWWEWVCSPRPLTRTPALTRGARTHSFRSWPCHLFSVILEHSCPSLALGFLIYKVRRLGSMAPKASSSSSEILWLVDPLIKLFFNSDVTIHLLYPVESF